MDVLLGMNSGITHWFNNHFQLNLEVGVVNVPECGVRGPRFKFHCRQLCLSWQPLRYNDHGHGLHTLTV